MATRGGTRAARSSFVPAASAPSQQQKQAMAVSRDDERSTGGSSCDFFRQTPNFLLFRITLQKELRSLEVKKNEKFWGVKTSCVG